MSFLRSFKGDGTCPRTSPTKIPEATCNVTPNVATNSMANATYLSSLAPEAASRYLRPAGGGTAYSYHQNASTPSLRDKATARQARATHIQCCPGQPRTTAADHQRCPVTELETRLRPAMSISRLAGFERRVEAHLYCEMAGPPGTQTSVRRDRGHSGESGVLS